MIVNDDWFMAILSALLLSHEHGRPFFVYRPGQPRPAALITDDEAQAAAACDADGYRRCDAAEAANDD
jgi:hypothetical protein